MKIILDHASTIINTIASLLAIFGVTMNLKIKELRKKLHISQSEFAEKVGASLRTVSSWERGETIPDAEKVWNCAVALGCTPNDILGWYETHPREESFSDTYEQELMNCYRTSTKDRKERTLDTARDAAAMSKDAAKRDLSASQEVSA